MRSSHTGSSEAASLNLGTNQVDHALLDVREVAAMLSCSVRHVYRLADAGRLPAPVKLGALVRWPRREIEQWIAAGCPSCKSAVRRHG